jgi:hypothetical protein
LLIHAIKFKYPPLYDEPTGRPRHKWEDSIKMDLQEVACGGVDWIELAHVRDRLWALVGKVINFQVP